MGLVPLAIWLHALDDGPVGRGSAMRGSLLFGTIYFGVLFYWILIALIWFTKLAILAYLATLGILMVMSAFFGWAMHRSLNSLRIPLWLALPVLWTALEWSRAHLPSTIAFPWLGLGTSLTGFPELVGVAEIIGSRGVTFWLAMINGLIATSILARRSERRMATASVTAAVIAVPIGWGVWRAATLETREVERVAVVQPNIPEHIKLDGEAGIDSTFASLDRLIPRIEPSSVDLVIMPEVTLRAYPELRQFAPETERIQRYSREVGVPVLFGSLGVEFGEGSDYTPFNSAFVMEPQGLLDWRYDKRYLVPFVERVPIIPPEWITGASQYFGGYGVGQGWPLLETEGGAYGVLICYESSYPEGSRRFRLAGADVLVNITNDAWYGREPLYARTTALWQHPAHMVMRAIENRVGVARAANTGISLFVDPVGRVHNATRLFEADVRSDVVRTTDVVTFYTRYGDLLGNGAAIAALLFVVASWHRARRERVDHPTASV